MSDLKEKMEKFPELYYKLADILDIQPDSIAAHVYEHSQIKQILKAVYEDLKKYEKHLAGIEMWARDNELKMPKK